MLQDYYQPALSGAAIPSYRSFDDDLSTRPGFQKLPVNLSAEEIRAMVRDLLG